MTIRIRLACMAACIASVGVCSAADPLDPKAPAAAPAYRSAFHHYRRHDDVKSVPWRQANDTVERTRGGHGHAHGAAQAPASASAPQAAPAPRGDATQHDGHRGHKH